jgi:hypothetical protein
MLAIMQPLATAASALPRDSSALEASISALKSSISALESSLKTLEGSSTRWEHLAIISSFAVVVGIVGEVAVIVSEDRENFEDWARGIVRLPDRAPRWRFWFDIAATIVVLLGVLGEAWGSSQLASINSQLRSKTSELRAKSDQLLALVTQEAGDAAQSAKAAHEQLGAVSKDADAIKAELTMAQWALGARHVVDQADLENGLRKEFKGRRIVFKSYVLDDEAFLLCRQYVSAATKPEVGVIVADECADEALPLHLPVSDLRITAPTIDEAQRLGMILKRPGVSGWVINLGLSPKITVLVGRHASIPLFWPKTARGKSE